MKKRVREDISAYLDGEAKDSTSIARLIADSTDASKEHVAYAELSARLRNLEAPEVHPAFATRVIASIQEQDERPTVRWRIPAGFTVAAMAVIVGVISYNSTQPTSPVAPQGTIATQSDIAPALAADENTLMAELERRVSQDADVQQFVAARFENSPQPDQLYSDRLIAAVAGSREAAMASGAFAHGMDYRAAVHRLDDAQAATLKQILSASMNEAHEG